MSEPCKICCQTCFRVLERRLSESESQLAAAKAQITDLEKRNSYETYECGLCPTETDLSVGHMYCCNCFDKSESETKRLREALEKIVSGHHVMQCAKGESSKHCGCLIARASLDGGKA